jgi:integrating conjugative element protein (TIGR03755 family)
MKARLPWVTVIITTSISLITIPSVFAASGLIPAVKSGLYYQMGGGNDVPLPAFYNTSTIPLDVDGDVGLGFDCGAFNPVASIKNSLNNIKNSALNVEHQVLNDATSAITEFPLYELSRADPNLYNLITRAMAGAREDIAVSTKSCEVMQSEIASGQDPYANWGQISLGNSWKQTIGTAETSGNGDINQARQKVSQDAGRSGVPWVNPDALSSISGVSTHNAGGVNQPPIHIIHDTALSGYGVIENSNHTTLAHSIANHTHSELATVFPTAHSAADWITNVVGDEIITTYNNGSKNSQPGVGLYTDIEYQTKQIIPKLQALVIGNTPLTLDNLNAISPENMTLSPDIIRTIQRQPKVIQGIVINKLAQNIAAMMVINKARLAMRILQSGSRIPAIYANQAAQKNIQQAISWLQQDIQNILMFIKARQELMSNMLSTVLSAGQSQETDNTAVAVPKPQLPEMEHGAVLLETAPSVNTD